MSEEKQNPRDTHFAGFAEALYEDVAHHVKHIDAGGMSHADIQALISEMKQEQCQMIARRAYDLALHVLINLNGLNTRWTGETEEHYRAYLEEMLQDDVPDLSELPKIEE